MLRVENTLFVGKVSLVEPTLASTNDHAISLLRQGPLLEGTLIYAIDQQNGRGQRGNEWHSAPGKNCTISIVLQPRMERLDAHFYLNKAVAVALCDTIRQWLPEARLKWPNDIYVGDRKIAGVLIENLFSGKKIKHSVLGIGVNVNQRTFGDGLARATSIVNETGQELDLQAFIASLCKHIEVRYLSFLDGQFEVLQGDYLRRLYRYEEVHLYQTKEGKLLAKIVDVNEQGQLVLQSDLGQTAYNFKELAYT